MGRKDAVVLAASVLVSLGAAPSADAAPKLPTRVVRHALALQAGAILDETYGGGGVVAPWCSRIRSPRGLRGVGFVCGAGLESESMRWQEVWLVRVRRTSRRSSCVAGWAEDFSIRQPFHIGDRDWCAEYDPLV